MSDTEKGYAAFKPIRFTLEKENFNDLYEDGETKFKVGYQEYLIVLGDVDAYDAGEILQNGLEEDEADEEPEEEEEEKEEQ